MSSTVGAVARSLRLLLLAAAAALLAATVAADEFIGDITLDSFRDGELSDLPLSPTITGSGARGITSIRGDLVIGATT